MKIFCKNINVKRGWIWITPTNAEVINIPKEAYHNMSKCEKSEKYQSSTFTNLIMD